MPARRLVSGLVSPGPGLVSPEETNKGLARAFDFVLAQTLALPVAAFGRPLAGAFERGAYRLERYNYRFLLN